MPLPRFVSLKSNAVNMRVGPGNKYRIEWQFVKKGLPVEIIQEFGNWRKVRSPDGSEGWVFHALLSGRRTAIVTPWNANNHERKVDMTYAANRNSAKVAVMEPGTLINVQSCDSSWCRISADTSDGSKLEGYVMQDKLWGVYPDETVE